SPERTFWEKATLIHVECHRGVRENAERLSRHWFDLTSLYSDDIGTQAIQNIELLKDVISLKSTFYNASYAHYGECLTGSFRLIPDPEGLTHLESDFSKMNEAGMLNHSSMSFEDVVERIRTIEAHMNQMITEFHV
ncbi:TPA: nucleotidyl transferase AbiEii/AbiGii toxin family protein, partial [Acinetobacter baumannii]